jgi:hypothetical protein
LKKNTGVRGGVLHLKIMEHLTAAIDAVLFGFPMLVCPMMASVLFKVHHAVIMKASLHENAATHENRHTKGYSRMDRPTRNARIPMLAAAMLLITALGCSVLSETNTTHESEIPTSNATPTRETTDAQSSSVPGIDEPIIVGAVEIQVLEAYTKENLVGTLYPDDPSDIFLEIVCVINGVDSAQDWGDENLNIIHEDEYYEVFLTGRKGGAGGVLLGYTFVFSIPSESEYTEYMLQLPGGVSIELASFFE